MSLVATPLEIPAILLLEPEVHTDDRGHFFEVWNERDFVEATGCRDGFVQDNQSRSARGVLRGLHYQVRKPQGKLVRVALGAAYTVAVDIRSGSQTFGRSVAVTLSAKNHHQLWIPPGFAHGFLALGDPTDVLYKVTGYFDATCDREIRWDDPELGIRWPLHGQVPAMSDRDRGAPLLVDAEI